MDRNEDYAILGPLEYNSRGDKMATSRNMYSKGLFNISNKNEYPEATIRWVDYFLSPEGTRFMRFGVEGIYWEHKGDGTWDFIKLTDTPDNWRAQLTPDAGSGLPVWIDPTSDVRKSVVPYLPLLKSDNELAALVVPYIRTPYPHYYMSEDQQKSIAPIEADTNSYVNQMRARFIVGDADFSEWDEYVNTLERMGIAELVEIYQQVYDAIE